MISWNRITRSGVALLCVATWSLALPGIAGAAQAKDDPTAVRVGGDIKPPARVKTVKPVYPPIARDKRVQGVVIVEATIGVDGKVKATKVLRSLALLDDAAVTAIKGWEFKPTLVSGKPVPVIMTIPVNFSLD